MSLLDMDTGDTEVVTGAHTANTGVYIRTAKTGVYILPIRGCRYCQYRCTHSKVYIRPIQPVQVLTWQVYTSIP